MNREQPSFSDVRRVVSNHMSLAFESDGFSPLVGKIYALLLFAYQPLSLQDIADQLGVTKAAVSVQARMLEKNLMCQKLPTSNDRKDYYYIAENFSLITMRTALQKLEDITKHLEGTLTDLRAMRDVPEGEQAAYQASMRRFAEVAAMYRLMLTRLDGIEEEWGRLSRSLFEGDFLRADN